MLLFNSLIQYLPHTCRGAIQSLASWLNYLHYHGDEKWEQKEGHSQHVEESEGHEYFGWSELITRVLLVEMGEGIGHKGRQDHLHARMYMSAQLLATVTVSSMDVCM